MKAKTKRSWEDIVFESLNKRYGAYFIRKIYARNVITAAILGILITSLLLTYPAIIQLFTGRVIEEVKSEVVKYTELAPPPPIEKNAPPPKKIFDAPPVRKVVEHLVPKTTNNPVEEKKDMSTVDERKNADIGAESKEGTGDATTTAPPSEVIDDRPVENENTVHEYVDFAAQFEGGQNEYTKFLRKNLRYPPRAKPRRVEGSVVLKFVIDTEGRISNIETLKSLDPDCDKEAMRVLQRMPAWKPAKKDGKPVKSYHRLSIGFKFVES